MTEDGSLVTPLTGWELLADPLLNKGTAFTEAERDALGLHGLLPPHVGTLEEQVSRRLTVLRRFASDLERYAFLSELQDNNETLFFALLEQNLEELLPLVYTPTVGAGCQQFSQLFPPLIRNGVKFKVDQTNNSYIFPGVGLGAVAVKARRVTDTMFMAAAKALAAASPASGDPANNLLPPITALRDVAFAVALATAIQAHQEGLTQGVETDAIEAAIRAKMWSPRYLPYRRADD
jgi:malic enzyme